METRPLQRVTPLEEISPDTFLARYGGETPLAQYLVDCFTLIAQCQRMPEAPSSTARDNLSHSLYRFQAALPEAHPGIYQIELEFTLLPRSLTADQQYNQTHVYAPCITFLLVASHRADLPWPELCGLLAYIEAHAHEPTDSTDKMC